MRVGIITLAGRFNYGNRLQNYATTRVYERLGFDVRSICLDDHRILRGLKRKLKEIIGRDCKAPEELMTPERLSAFDRFNDFMDAETVNSPGAVDIDKYDYFSVGSDQVWNPNYMKHREGWFFLKFAHPEQRIALAPRVCRHEMWYNIGGVNKEREANMEDASYHRHDIDDRAWSIIEPLLPGQKGQWGGVAEDNRRFVNAVFWVLRTGAPWRDLPPDYGGWKNTHRRFCRWRDKGVWERLLEAVVDDPDFEG